MMAILRSFLRLVVTTVLLKLAMAANHTVGGPNGGWDATSDLQTWTASQRFLVGDNLIFQYAPNHDVLEVSQADYDSCQISSPLQAYNGGNTIIPLSSPGKRYFICGTPGHCGQGMKAEIDTLATSTLPSAPSGNPSPSESPASLLPPAPLIIPPVSPLPPETSKPTLPESPEFTPALSPILLPASPSDSPVSTLSSTASTSATGFSPPHLSSLANKNNYRMAISLVMIVTLFV